MEHRMDQTGGFSRNLPQAGEASIEGQPLLAMLARGDEYYSHGLKPQVREESFGTNGCGATRNGEAR